jgi:hypothetical protein
MNDQELIPILAKIVEAIETIGERTANLISSGDPVDAINENPGSSAIAGSLRCEVIELRALFDKTLGNPGA